MNKKIIMDYEKKIKKELLDTANNLVLSKEQEERYTNWIKMKALLKEYLKYCL